MDKPINQLFQWAIFNSKLFVYQRVIKPPSISVVVAAVGHRDPKDPNTV